MSRPLVTDDEKRQNRIAAYNKYNAAHREERIAHNRIYSKQEHVKARRRELYRIKTRSATESAIEATPDTTGRPGQ